MIKKTISLLFILGFSLGISAQKKNQKKNSKIDKAAIEAMEAAAAAVAADAASGYNYSDHAIDTLNYSAGKAYVFLIKADESNSKGFGDDLEEKELKKNFDKNAFEIININKYSYITFENGQFLDVSSIGNSYDAIAFWSGKNDDDIQTQETREKATEFVARQLGLKKESSYITNTKKFKSEIAAFKNNFTPKSKAVQDAFLKRFTVPTISYIEDDTTFVNQNSEKVKTAKTFITAKNGKKGIYEFIQLNEKNQPVVVTRYNSDGSEDGSQNFVYQNDILKEIKSADNTASVVFDNDQLIITKNIGEADETRIYWIENGNFLSKSYTMMIDDNFSHMNSFSEEKIKNNCAIYEINGIVWSENCGGKEGVFPFTHTYTSYQDGEILQKKNYKVTKKSEVLYELFIQNSSNDDQDLIPRGTYHLNEKGLIKTYVYAKDDEAKNIEIEYTYFP